MVNLEDIVSDLEKKYSIELDINKSLIDRVIALEYLYNIAPNKQLSVNERIQNLSAAEKKCNNSVAGGNDLESSSTQAVIKESQDQINMATVIPYILELQRQKSTVYGRSYCRHGDLSIFFNLERKWDRIANIMEKAMKTGMDNLFQSGTPTETFFDTVIDLASYSLLWAGYISETHPEILKQFIEDNKLGAVKM